MARRPAPARKLSRLVHTFGGNPVTERARPRPVFCVVADNHRDLAVAEAV